MCRLCDSVCLLLRWTGWSVSLVAHKRLKIYEINNESSVSLTHWFFYTVTPPAEEHWIRLRAPDQPLKNPEVRMCRSSYRWRRSCCLRPKRQCEGTWTLQPWTCGRLRWSSSLVLQHTSERSERTQTSNTNRTQNIKTLLMRTRTNQCAPSWSCQGSEPGSRPAVLGHGRWWVLLGWCDGPQPPADEGGPARGRGTVCGESL